MTCWIGFVLNCNASPPAALPMVESVLNQARQTWGGNRVYVRNPERQTVTRQTLQRRQRVERAHD